MEIGIGHMTAGAELVAIKVNRLEYPVFGSAAVYRSFRIVLCDMYRFIYGEHS
jgi:hypothetical protein